MLPIAPQFSGTDYYVPIRNAGAGPALKVRAQISFGDVEGNPSTLGAASDSDTELAGISHLESWVTLTFRRVPVQGATGFVLRLTYEDVAGQSWTTEARYSKATTTFPEVSIAAAKAEE
jgi:hypothetical protein